MPVTYICEGDKFCFRHHTTHLLKDAHTTHSHNVYEMIYFVSGDATYVVENRRYKLKSGDLIITRPFTPHFIQIDSDCDYERYNILFDPEFLNIKSIKLLDRNFDILNLKNHPLADAIIQKFDFYFKHFEKNEFVNIASLLLGELFYIISIENIEQRDVPSEGSPTLSRALEYIDKHLTTLTGVNEVAKNCFVTESYLYRIFKRELNHSPKKYINEKRLLLAGKRIQNGEKPTEVYEQCGFTDYTTFYRNFVSLFHRPPSSKNVVAMAENGFHR